MAPFASAYSNDALVVAVRAVTEHVNARRPKTVTIRAFDAARAAAGHPDCPRAARICERLDMSWPEVKAAALDPGRDPDITIGRRLGESDIDASVAKEDGARCLRVVATRLGIDTLDPDRYDGERGRILAENRRRHRHGRALVFPTSHQLVTLFGSFAAALKAAGLKGYAHPPSIPIAEALELHMRRYGCIVPSVPLRVFAKASGFRLEHGEGKGRFARALAEFRAQREAAGLPVPDGYPPKAERPCYEPGEIIAEAAARAPFRSGRTKADRWTTERCVRALMRLMDERPGVQVKLTTYRDLTAGDDAYPASSALGRYGGLVALRREAERRRRKRGPLGAGGEG